jgi:hypothetical protein
MLYEEVNEILKALSRGQAHSKDILLSCHSLDERESILSKIEWIPAFAGMTICITGKLING